MSGVWLLSPKFAPASSCRLKLLPMPEERLVVTHFSPMSGQDDVPENYHRVTYRLDHDGDVTRVTLEQDNAPEESVEDFRANWETMLGNLKELVERG